MPMTYTSLLAPKGTSGSILNWINYNKLDVESVLDESQALIYSMLRCREMRLQWIFGLPVGNCKIALPPYFLDPIGALIDNFGQRYWHKTEADITRARQYDTSPAGSFGANPFTSGAIGSGIVTCVLANHGLNQGGDITILGATAVDGIALNTTSLITGIIDVNTFTIAVENAAAVAGNVTGGGSAATYTANNLIQTSPAQWSVWDEFLQFDGAFYTATQFRLMYFGSKPLLSASSPTNFLTSRYPQLIRVATQAAAASFMKDDDEYAKHVQGLQGVIQTIQSSDDGIYRGADLTTDTPYSGYYGGDYR